MAMKEEKRVVSFFIWDPELERKINCEVKMIDGISKLLNVATTMEQTIECHKALVLSQQRMLAFMAEIQRKQRNLLERDDIKLQPTKATILLSDIRLPLVWTNIKAKSEQKKFAVFCLARIGCEIIDTQLKSIDKQSSEILFTDKLVFDNVPHNFQLHLEIYALNKSFALSTAAKDFANRYSQFSNHGSSNFTRKSPNINGKSPPEQQSKFVLIARTVFTKDSVFKMAKVRTLKMEPRQSNPLMQLPIHTSFIARFLVQPVCYTRSATFAGMLQIYNFRYSCTLAEGFLNGEEIIQEDFSDQHRFSIPITPDTIITVHDEQCSFTVYNQGFDQEEFIAQDAFTLKLWIHALEQHIVDINAWQVTFEHLPSIRHRTHRLLPSSPISSINEKNRLNQSNLTNKTQSLDNLHQTDDYPQTSVKDRPHSVNHTHDQHNLDDDDDDYDTSEYHTRL